MNLAEKGIIIRKTIESDLREIYLAAADAPEFSSGRLTADHLADLFTSVDSIMYSAVRKKRVLGFLTGRLRGNEAVVEAVFVKDKFRSSGIGTSLLNSFTKRSEKACSEIFFIAVPDENIKCINFFIRRGFVQESSTINLRRKHI